MTNEQNNKRIAKNTLMLYFRLILTMLITLYTTRIVLSVLGVNDFGIYNVIAGFVMLFSFLNGAMATATQRFLSYEIGKNDQEKLKKVFSMSINIHLLIALVILLIAETIGLWFVNNHLNVPLERLNALNWVYQFSVLTLLVNVISVPYNATIIAYEKMEAFAYIGIIEVTLKLFIVFVLQWFTYDNLKFYAILVFLVSLIIRVLYSLYCNHKFKNLSYKWITDLQLFKTMANFAGWNIWGSFAVVISGQGINILLNIFTGPVVNAARGISYQVSGALTNFVTNFQVALNPQIIKSYASENKTYMHNLIFKGAKYSFFLMFIISLPIFLETEYILKLWLKTVPDYTIIFTRLIIVIVLIDCISGTLRSSAQASGRIKLIQLIEGFLLISILPLSYLFLKIGFSPEITLVINIVISFVIFIVRLFLIAPLVNLSKQSYVKQVIYPIFVVAVFSLITPVIIMFSINLELLRLIFVFITSVLSTGFFIWLLGIDIEEKKIIVDFVRIKIKQKTKHKDSI